MDNKAPDAFRTISEVADELDVPQHVLRFWETRFRDIRPMKRGGGRRYYRPDDVDLLRGIRHLLYGEGYTIRGVQRILHEEGPKFVQAVWQPDAPQPPHRSVEGEDAVDEAETADETTHRPGLRGRLSSLIGHDLGERSRSERRDPPMQPAPVPRIDPHDRPVHSQPIEADPPMRAAPAIEPQPVAPAAPLPPMREALPREDLRKLQAALHELGECRKLLQSVSPAR